MRRVGEEMSFSEQRGSGSDGGGGKDEDHEADEQGLLQYMVKAVADGKLLVNGLFLPSNRPLSCPSRLCASACPRWSCVGLGSATWLMDRVVRGVAVQGAGSQRPLHRCRSARLLFLLRRAYMRILRPCTLTRLPIRVCTQPATSRRAASCRPQRSCCFATATSATCSWCVALAARSASG